MIHLAIDNKVGAVGLILPIAFDGVCAMEMMPVEKCTPITPGQPMLRRRAARRVRRREHRKVGRALGVLLIGCALAGCAPRTSTHGDPLVLQRVDSIVKGVHSREDVYALLGSPSTSAVFGDETWYYISTQTETIAFLPREETDRQVIAVQFDQRGIVQSVENFGKERGQDVAFVNRETPTFGTDMSLLQQFLGNLGRFNKEETERGASGGGQR